MHAEPLSRIEIARAPGGDRTALERILSMIDLRPPNLPPGATLIVRKLATQRQLGGDVLSAARAWQHELGAAMSRELARAARPWHAPPAPGDSAVWFADESELVACLLRDLTSGALSERWWWARWLGGAASSEAAYDAVERNARALPAALARLDRVHELSAVLAVVPAVRLRAWTLAVARVIGVERAISEAVEALEAVEEDGVPPGTHSNEPVRQLATRIGVVVPAATNRMLPREVRLFAAVALSFARQRLLFRETLLGPALAHVALGDAPVSAPERVATARTAEQAGTVQSEDPRIAALRELEPAPRVTVPTWPRDEAEGPQEHAMFDSQDRSEQFPSGTDVTKAQIASAVKVAADRVPDLAKSAASIGTRTPAAQRFRGEVVGAPTLAPPRASAELETAELRLEQRVPESDEACIDVRTSHGGVLFLVNALLALGLYPDFTEPFRQGAALDLWHAVSGVGAALLGDARDPDDALWDLLSTLGGVEPTHVEQDGTALPVGEWIAQVVGDVRSRLHDALDGSAEDVRAPLSLTARVRAVPTRVDAFFALADLPLPVRYAGLDRDPGWLPSVGRTLAFHFD